MEMFKHTIVQKNKPLPSFNIDQYVVILFYLYSTCISSHQLFWSKSHTYLIYNSFSIYLSKKRRLIFDSSSIYIPVKMFLVETVFTCNFVLPISTLISTLFLPTRDWFGWKTKKQHIVSFVKRNSHSLRER